MSRREQDFISRVGFPRRKKVPPPSPQRNAFTRQYNFNDWLHVCASLTQSTSIALSCYFYPRRTKLQIGYYPNKQIAAGCNLHFSHEQNNINTLVLQLWIEGDGGWGEWVAGVKTDFLAKTRQQEQLSISIIVRTNKLENLLKRKENI